MKLLVCGSRTFDDEKIVDLVLDSYQAEANVIHNEDLVIRHGDAKGADALAKAWAIREGVEQEPFPADWEGAGRKAGIERNSEMLQDGTVDAGVAFLDKPLTESRGTFDMVKKLQGAGKAVLLATVL